jgi:hypothetical protein
MNEFLSGNHVHMDPLGVLFFIRTAVSNPALKYDLDG